METIAQRIKIGMEIRQLKQTDLVEKTGISKGALSSYISGRYEPKQNNIYLIAKALDVSEAWLMGVDVPMEKNRKEMDCNLIEKCYGSKAYELVELFIKLNDIGKAKAIEELSDMVQLAKYTKHEKRENSKMA